MRTAQLDADNRRPAPQMVECYCVRCHKVIKAGQPRRHVIIRNWEFVEVVHPEDTAEYDWNNEPGMFPVGMDCARKIGMEFTKALPG